MVCQVDYGRFTLRADKAYMWHLILFWQRETWRAFWRRPTVYLPAALAFCLLVVTWYLVVRVWQQETVIMRYSIYVGTNWLVPAGWLYILPVLATITVLVDLILAYVIARSSLVIRYLWLWLAVFMASGFAWLSWLFFRINS